MHEINIEWEVSEQNLRQELVSKDRRWHIAKTQIGNEGPKFFMSNYDLLLMPHGMGADYRECFTTFIADCDKFIALAQKIKAEAEEHLAALCDVGQEAISEKRDRQI